MPADPIDDFIVASTGGPFRRSDHRGAPVVLYFYPKAWRGMRASGHPEEVLAYVQSLAK